MKRIFTVVLILLLSGCFFDSSTVSDRMIDLSTMSLNQINKYVDEHNLNLKIDKIYSEEIEKDKIIGQSISKNTVINSGDTLTITISLGPIPVSVYQENKVNELGNVPIMMYHKIVNMTNDETKYTGGNVDRDGYNRTAEAFKKDLEMYYNNGYRMVRLTDYMNGNIDTKLGKSPIVLTFDDGNKDNINVLGIDDSDNLIIDPDSAIGILEIFKAKYPDFKVTATFFLNSNLFGQPQYNKQILEWLIDNGYDIGNHTKNHVDFENADASVSQEEVAYMYRLFDTIIPNKYIHVVALPYGSPYKKTHPNFSYILSGTNEEYTYTTDSTLQVGWDAEYSPFHKNFDRTFMKRVRAWDNDGIDFDIKMVFNNLENKRYISDGNPNYIVIPDDCNLNIDIPNKKIIKY